MKFALIAAFATVAISSSCFAADVNVVGANNLRTVKDQTTNAMDSQAKDVAIATQSLLNDSTGLVNKNTLVKDNNIFISRSNIIFMQNDRMAMRKKVRDALTRKSEDNNSEQAMGAATLTKNVLRAVSADDKDSIVMTKASAVVAAKDLDDATLSQRIADFVDAAGKREMEQEEQQEQTIQSQVPRGITVLVGTKDILRQPTGVVNKNIAPSDNQIVITRSNIQPSQDDNVVLSGQSKVADAVLPASVVNVNAGDRMNDAPMFRVKVAYRKQQDKQQDKKDADDDASSEDKQEQFGLWGAGWGLGWRYPLSYWNSVGSGLYGGGCGLGFSMGGFYYC